MPHRPSWIAALLALLNLAPFSPAFASDTPPGERGVRLLHSDSRGVTLELEVGAPILTPLPTASDFAELRLPGFAPTGSEGEPALPARTLWVGVPEGATIHVEASALETRSFEGVRLAPRLLVGTDSEDPEAAQPALVDRLAALASGPAYLKGQLAASLAVVRGVSGLRSQRVAAIEVRPARYDAGSRHLEVATRIMLQVTFEGRATAASAAPLEPAFEGIYRDLLVNYQSARAFRRPVAWDRQAAPGIPQSRTTAAFDPAATWIRVRVASKGVQEILGSDLETAGVPLAGVVPGAIRLFTQPGVPQLPEASFCDSCGLAEVAIRIEGGEDGRLDPGDRILFFGLGASGWQDDFTGPGGAPDEWLDHSYERQNVYWLALNDNTTGTPARWAARDVSPSRPGAIPATQYTARLHFEANLVYQPELYEPGFPWDQWAWNRISSLQGAVPFDADASGAVEGLPARLRARVFPPSSLNSTYGTHRLSATFNDLPLNPEIWSGPGHRDLDTTTAGIVDGPNRLSLALAASSSSANPDQVYALFWELRFARRFLAVNDTLEFASTGISEPAAYTLAPFTEAAPTSFLLLDVSDPRQPVELTGWIASDTTGGQAVHFQDVRDSAFYFAATAAARRTPQLELANVRDIRHGGADYLVICSDAFEGDALRLAAHRGGVAPPFPGASAAVVRMSDILAWYAGGRMDPVAIRNFLHDAVAGGQWSPAPSYVCLLGDASFDYKDILGVGEPGLGRTQVPTFGHNHEAYQYPSDDWLADLDTTSEQFRIAGGIPDLITGRLPAANAAEAAALVDKMLAYDARSSPGPWRNRLLSLVDDLNQGSQPDPIGGGHIQQADSLEHDNLPDWMDRKKVELIEYPFTQGTSKDGARRDLLRLLDEGAVFWHYIGHGNPFKLADENAFLRDDVAGMSNGARQPFFFAAASAVGPFDSPYLSSLAEALVKRPAAGSIASYAGTITTFSYANFELGRVLYDALLNPPELGGARTIGEASFVAKHRNLASENDRKYHVLGDPGTRLATPRDDLRLGVYDDATGEALGDSLPRGRRVRIEGEVHGTRDRAISDLRTDRAGEARILVTDAPVRQVVYSAAGIVGYDANPRTAYEYDVPVSNGRFVTRFVVPMQATLGARARVSAYFSGSGTDGSGAAVARIVDGTPDAADTTGPVLDVRFAGGGSLVGPEEFVTVTIEDPSGILTLGGTPLDPITIAYDTAGPVIVTPAFRYDLGSATRGSVRFLQSGISEGQHTLTVSASDNLAGPSTPAQHRSTKTVAFRVVGVAASVDVRAWVLPNPFVANTGTDLVFTGIPGASTAEVGIYDIRGRLVRRLESASDAGHVQVRWDGRDAHGGAVAAGIYLYQASVKPVGAAELGFRGRLVLLR